MNRPAGGSSWLNKPVDVAVKSKSTMAVAPRDQSSARDIIYYNISMKVWLGLHRFLGWTIKKSS